MAAYYNEIDPGAAAWLRELIKRGMIAPGDVDERSIEDVRPDDLKNYTQCHFFAGIGIWSYALRLAGWPDDRPVWTGSCPCQPFSTAGKGDGFADERHLWPHWQHLIKERRPTIVYGEQVASKDGLAWLDLVQADLEAEKYAFGAFDICAAGFGAPHIRQRLFFVGVDEWLGNAVSAGLEGHAWDGDNPPGRPQPAGSVAETGGDGRLADAAGEQWQWGRVGEPCHGRDQARIESSRLCSAGGLADTERNGSHRASGNATKQGGNGAHDGLFIGGGEGLRGATAGKTNGFWSDSDWLFCRDGKFRPVEPGTFPLVDGAAERVGRLRGYGNGINAEVAAQFIKESQKAIQEIWG